MRGPMLCSARAARHRRRFPTPSACDSFLKIPPARRFRRMTPQCRRYGMRREANRYWSDCRCGPTMQCEGAGTSSTEGPQAIRTFLLRSASDAERAPMLDCSPQVGSGPGPLSRLGATGTGSFWFTVRPAARAPGRGSHGPAPGPRRQCNGWASPARPRC